MRETALSIRFFEDLVRLPNYNSVIPSSSGPRKRSLRFPNSPEIPLVVRASWFPPSALRFPESLHESRCRSSRMSLVCSLPLEDLSSVKRMLLRNQKNGTHFKTFFIVEIPGEVWKILRVEIPDHKIELTCDKTCKTALSLARKRRLYPDFLKIWFGFQTTAKIVSNSFRRHEHGPFSPLSFDTPLVIRASLMLSYKLPVTRKLNELRCRDSRCLSSALLCWKISLPMN